MGLNLQQLLCKTCGEPLDLSMARNGVIKCSICDSVYTLPKDTANQKVLDFLSQGEHDLDTGKFDDAYTAFSKAAGLDPTEPEAYWGMALADFKVQYLKDEVNNRLQPICNDLNEKVFADNINVCKAIRYATNQQRVEYERKAKEIDYIKREFTKISKHGTDYDCFICVKVTDEYGGKTTDYKIAEDIYFALRKKGYKPFFSEMELDGVVGADYEARILYALHSAKCMLVVCSNETYLRTPWVKNEYARFLKLVNDEEKESDSITFVYKDTPIEKLPGRNGKIQGIEYNLTAMEKIISFVDRHTHKRKLKQADNIARHTQGNALSYKTQGEQVVASKKFDKKFLALLLLCAVFFLTVLSITLQSLGLYVFTNSVLKTFKVFFGVGIGVLILSLIAAYFDFSKGKKWFGLVHLIITAGLIVMTIFSGISNQLNIINFYIDGDCGVVYAEKADKNVVWGIAGNAADIEIYGTVNGVTVTDIRKSAFEGNKYINSIKFENCNLTVGETAFKNCNRLEVINFDKATCLFGKSSLSGCPSLKNINLDNSYVSGDSVSANRIANTYLNNSSLLTFGSFSNLTLTGNCTITGNNISTLIFEEGVDIESQTKTSYTTITGFFKYTTYYLPAASTIYIPKSATSIPDYFFGTYSAKITVYYAGTSEEWEKIKIGSEGNDNYYSNTTVNYNHPYEG